MPSSGKLGGIVELDIFTQFLEQDVSFARFSLAVGWGFGVGLLLLFLAPYLLQFLMHIAPREAASFHQAFWANHRIIIGGISGGVSGCVLTRNFKQKS